VAHRLGSGLAEWQSALEDYRLALQLGQQATGFEDPYILNNEGNVYATLGTRHQSHVRIGHHWNVTLIVPIGSSGQLHAQCRCA